ncbi:MAG TPA: RodZ domain-containing protein [Burkholderiales bacterium]|nr:RodZ domain-containing protein [Burkholderiales bacterium]
MSQGYYARSDASSAGASLAAAREEMNLSISDVARHLKLTTAQVEALEEGAYERLPGRVFVRGFLRNYAKLLGVDPQPLLRRIEHEMPQPRVVQEAPHQPEAVMPTGEKSKIPLYAGIVAIIVAALAAYEFGFNSPPAAEGPPQAAAVPAAPAAADADPSTTPETAATPPTPVGAALPAKPPAGAATAPAPSAPPPTASGAPLDPALSKSPAPGQPSPVARAGERELHFRFETESWVEIRDRNDKVIFSKLNRAGAEERVTGTPPLKLVVGNARGVRLNYGDQSVDLTPHIGVTVARLTLE